MDSNSTTHNDGLNHDLTIAILAFTIGGFLLSAYNTGCAMWKSVTNTSPRNISNDEAKLVANNILDKMPDILTGNNNFLTKLAGALDQHHDD